MKIILKSLAIFLALLYLSLALLLWSPVYTSIVLQPGFGPEELYLIDKIGDAGRKEFYLSDADPQQEHKLHLCYWKKPGATRVIIFHHGNAGNLLNRLFYAKTLLDLGFSVVLYDYRGYGRSSGQASLNGLLQDGDTVFDFVHNVLGYKNTDIILFGESIGSAVACHVAKSKAPAALILQSPISSLPDVARSGPFFLGLLPDFLFPQPHYNNLQLVRELKMPTLILHGKKDALVPWQQGELLYKASKASKQLVFLPHAGHNNMGDVDAEVYRSGLLNFLRREKFVDDKHSVKPALSSPPGSS